MYKTVKIAGAGISGLSAAINLAKNGYEVAVYEKNSSFTREDICAIRNYDLPDDALAEFRKYGISLKPQSKIRKVRKFSPNHSMDQNGKKNIFYLFERGSRTDSIENQLLRTAEDLGVRVNFGKQVEDRNVDIVATGSTRKDIMAYGHIYRDIGLGEDTVYIIYDNLYAPNGYIYVLTANGRSAIISVSFDRNKFRYLPVNFSLFLRKNELLRKNVKNRKPITNVSGFGNYDILKTARNNGRYMIGESGFFMDSSKGFGIRYAVITGYLAAKSISSGLSYDTLWKDLLKDEMKRDFKRRILLNRFTNRDYDLMLMKMGSRVDIDKYLKETRKMKKHIDLFFPLYMWGWKLKK